MDTEKFLLASGFVLLVVLLACASRIRSAMLNKETSPFGSYWQGDKDGLKLLIGRYQQRIFALVLYLIRGDKDKAYDITASSFVETLCTTSFPAKGHSFLTMLARAAVEKSRDVKIMPSCDESDFMGFPPERRGALLIVKRALQALPFNEKVLLLLRDQLRFSYRDISAILRISENTVRVQTTQAMVHLREKIEKAL